MTAVLCCAFRFSNDFQGFLNSYLAGFETCALFDLENPSLQVSQVLRSRSDSGSGRLFCVLCCGGGGVGGICCIIVVVVVLVVVVMVALVLMMGSSFAGEC